LHLPLKFKRKGHSIFIFLSGHILLFFWEVMIKVSSYSILRTKSAIFPHKFNINEWISSNSQNWAT
jgi:hypothetical protein